MEIMDSLEHADKEFGFEEFNSLRSYIKKEMKSLIESEIKSEMKSN